MIALPDPSPVFSKYETLRDSVDALFLKLSLEYADCVKCHEGCGDCCHAVFDLSLVEAMYLNRKFQDSFNVGPERSEFLQLAATADRKIHRFKRKILKEEQAGRDLGGIMAEAARFRQRCPLLDQNDRCRLYAFRPITCRIYGVPANIGGQAHSCGKSAFKPGEQYPTVSLETINRRLAELSLELARLLGSPYVLHEVFVPLPMALLGAYDHEYFGLEASGRNGK